MVPMMLLGFAKKAVSKSASRGNSSSRSTGTSKGKKKYYFLNFMRLLNMLSLVASGISTGSLIAKSSLSLKTSIFNIFDAAEKILLLTIILFLLATETPKLNRTKLVTKNWPLFSHNAGFSALAFAMTFVGTDVLSYLTKKGTDKKSLGADWYRLCLAAGVMTLVAAATNLLATVFCADRARKLTARQVRSGGRAASAGAGGSISSSAADVESAGKQAYSVPRKPVGAVPPQRTRMV